MSRCLVALLLLIAVMASPGNALTTVPVRPVGAAVPPSSTSLSVRLHVILVGDTTDALTGPSAAQDLENFKCLFSMLVPNPAQLNLLTVDGRHLNRVHILRTITGLRPRPDDAVIFIWSGHGACDDIGGHYFCTPDGDRLYRNDVVSAIRTLRTRLTVVLSGSCNDYSKPIELEQRRHTAYRPIVIPDQQMAPLFEELFVNASGVADINGASEKQISLATPEGDSFLHPLYRLLWTNWDRRLSWQSLVDEVTTRVESNFKRVVGTGLFRAETGRLYTEQRPKVWSLPASLHRPRLGVAATDWFGQGVQVLDVFRGYPASQLTYLTDDVRCSLERNDVIVMINGTPIRNIWDFANAVRLSPKRMNLTVRNWRDGSERLVVAELRY